MSFHITILYLLVPYMMDKYINSTFTERQTLHFLVLLSTYVLYSKYIQYYLDQD